jgi:phosphoglucosamine mutase
MSLKYFGTDGIRGTYGNHPITEAFATRFSVGLVRYLQKTVGSTPTIVTGCDTRESGSYLVRAFAESFSRLGCNVIDLGVIPTPQVSFAVRHHKASLGLVVTASHNPAEDNGFKLFNSSGTKFTPEQEQEIETCIDSNETTVDPGKAGAVVQDEGQTSERYLNSLRDQFAGLDLNGVKIAVDTANGGTSGVTPQFLESLGAQVFCIANQPDGININRQVGSEYPEALQRKVVESACRLGIAHDGDGDRVVIVDDSGEILSGEHFMAIVAKYSAKNAATPENPLITTIQSNLALDQFIRDLGSSVIRTAIGDRNLVYEMLSTKGSFGGENSGHYIFSDILPTGDGLVAALKLVEILQKTGQPLKSLKNEFTLFPSKMTNLRIAEKLPLHTLPTLHPCQLSAQDKLGSKGRILLRYSGTENKLRILVECESEELLQSLMGELIDAAKKDLKVIS